MKDYYKILNEIASVFNMDQWNIDTVFDKEMTYQLSDIDIRTIGNGTGFERFKCNFTRVPDNKMIHEINVILASLFKTKDNFIKFLTECIKRNWEYVCNTSWDFLDTFGWEQFINDAITEVLKEWNLPFVEPEMQKYIFEWSGIVWCMVAENELDIELPDHPESP